MTAERHYLRPGTVVRHAEHDYRWGIIVSADPAYRKFVVRWRDGEEQDKVSHASLIRAAAPCQACGLRADEHRLGDDHPFRQETP